MLSYTVTYKDASGAEKTVTATRDSATDKWSGLGVDGNTGVMTLSVEDIKVGGTVTATAKDKCGLEGDTDKLASDPATKNLETATVSYAPNGGTGNMESKELNKGSKYNLLANSFTAPENQKFKGWKIGDTEYAPNAEITVKEDTTVTAIWEDKKEEVKVSFNHGDGASGTMEDKTVNKGSKYDLPKPTFTPEEGKKFVGWKVGNEDGVKKVGEQITVTGDVTLTAVWEDNTETPDGGNTNPGGQPDPKPGTESGQTPGEEPAEPENPTEPEQPEEPKTPEKPIAPDKPSSPAKPADGDKKDKKDSEGNLKSDAEDRLRIRYNPNGGHWKDNSTDILTYYYDKGNILTLINPPTREGYRFLYWKGSAYKPGDKYTVVDDHMFVAQWEKIGTKASRSNPKTGLESVAGVVCTLVASTGALYIGRKKED